MENKMKIVITGGLGYVGTALCKEYYNSNHEVIVFDNRFIPEQVKTLKEHKIKYYERDLFDSADLIKDADIIYHLVSITDVAYTNTESDPEKDALIKRIGIEGSRYVMSYTKKDAKFIFPSSHVVFEGLQETTFDLKEEDEPKPVLAYALSKRQTELDLINSSLNYIILRFASIYGYGENMRIKIVANLFSKIASQNGTIKLFGRGINYKPLVCINDVVKFLKFIAHNDKYNREIFHLVNENLTVKQIAEICREANPNVNIIETDDEIPNLGYTLSNKKLLNTGFNFKYNIRDEVFKMINFWKNE
jgi:UDP-glucose 4-epimerase